MHTPEPKSLPMKKFGGILFPFLLSIVFWIADGSRLSPWATKIEVRQEVPIIDGMPELGSQTRVTWINEFVCGIETPILGLFFSFVLYAILYFRKKKFE